MRKITAVIIGLLIAVIVFVAGNAYIQNRAWSDGVAKLDEWSAIEGNEYNGGIGDIVIGNKDAKVKVIEYADFQCSACAITFPYIHEAIKDYKPEEVAFIFRIYTLSYHKNATAAATAAIAAHEQGFFEEFAETLFKTQDDWYESEGEERDKQFEEYFVQVAGDKGDIDRYHADLKKSGIKNKLSVDRELATRVNLTGTPLVFVNKEKFEFSSTKESEFKKLLTDRIDAALKKS